MEGTWFYLYKTPLYYKLYFHLHLLPQALKSLHHFLPSDFLLMDTVWSLESYQAVQGSIVNLVVYVGSRLTLLLQIDKKNDLVKYRQAAQRELDLCVLRALGYPGFEIEEQGDWWDLLYDVDAALNLWPWWIRRLMQLGCFPRYWAAPATDHRRVLTDVSEVSS